MLGAAPALGQDVSLEAPLLGTRRSSLAEPLRPGRPHAIGIDAGSTTCKAVALDAGGRLLATATTACVHPVEDARALLAELTAKLAPEPLRSAVLAVTGYAAPLLAPLLGAELEVLETVAHARAARAIAPDADVVCDVGGQDVKLITLDPGGSIRDFRLSSQCCAGIGTLLEATARELGVEVEDYADWARAARRVPSFDAACAVFVDAARVSFQRQGFTADEVLAGLARALPRLVWRQIAGGVPAGQSFVLQGGVHRNAAVLEAELDFLAAEAPGARVAVHPHPAHAGAIGAALLGLDARAGAQPRSIDVLSGAAVALRSDETTSCRVCESHCPRTLIEVTHPERATIQHVSGFGCAEGALLTPRAGRARASARRRGSAPPNLLAEEVRVLFGPTPMPTPVRRADKPIRIGIPRMLGMYRAAPLFRAYLEAVGVASDDLVFSPVTSEALWREGARFGASDPCFPVKVALAHVHHLARRGTSRARPLDAVLVPHLTHAFTGLEGCVDSASCPVVAGVPALVKAAFCGPGGELARKGIRLLDPVITLTDRKLLEQQLHDGFAPLLGLTRDESDRATEVGMAALRRSAQVIAKAGRALLDDIARGRRKSAVLVLGRPYHADPGLNHRLGEELGALGFAVLTIRSLPMEPASLDVSELVPGVVNSGTAERLWAARFAAQHGRLGVVDLSSFKCGQDAQLHTPVRELLEQAGVPLCALHDLDETRPVASLRLRLKTFAQAMADKGLAP